MLILQHAVLFLITLVYPIYANQTNDHSKEIAKEYCYLADHLMHAGKTNKAHDLYLKAVSIDENNDHAHAHLGELFFQKGDTQLAIKHFIAALALNDNDFHSHFNLSQCYIKNQAWVDALIHLKKTVAFDATHEKAFINLGSVHEKLNQFDDAIIAYKKAVAINPTLFESYCSLGNLYRHLERLEEAVEPYEKAYALQPENLNIIMDLANTYNMLNENEKSLTLYKKIIEKNPNAISALYNFGFTLKKMGKLTEALDIYKKVLEKKPDYAPVHFSLSSIYLALGNLEKGWEEYEWRWKSYNESPLRHSFPAWEGQDLNNKILLVIAEQGLGDTLQFIRYIPLLKERYPKVRIIFESQEPLITLLKQQRYFDLVISRNQKPTSCDYQIALMSIPGVVKTQLETIPANIPYIHPNPDLVTKWQDLLAHDKNFKIGLCWQGNAGYNTQALRRAVALKSIHLKQFAPLFELPNVSIYCLQHMHGIDQINECSFKDKLIRFDESFDATAGRFMDTAAVMHQLDLVISVDTGTCHLAAAMNIPTWIILPFPSDWRWFLNRNDSPWYPSVKLFRQEKPTEWDSSIMLIVQQIKQILSKKKNNDFLSQTTAVYQDKPTYEQQMFFKKISSFE